MSYYIFVKLFEILLEEYIMRRKYFLLTSSIIICLSILFVSCSNKKPLKPDTPANTAFVMKNFLDAGDYEKFNNLFTDVRKNSISLEQFNELKKLTTVGTDYKHYELLTFSNGKMILIMLTQDKINGEYKIQNVKEVTDDLKSLLK